MWSWCFGHSAQVMYEEFGRHCSQHRCLGSTAAPGRATVGSWMQMTASACAVCGGDGGWAAVSPTLYDHEPVARQCAWCSCLALTVTSSRLALLAHHTAVAALSHGAECGAHGCQSQQCPGTSQPTAPHTRAHPHQRSTAQHTCQQGHPTYSVTGVALACSFSGALQYFTWSAI